MSSDKQTGVSCREVRGPAECARYALIDRARVVEVAAKVEDVRRDRWHFDLHAKGLLLFSRTEALGLSLLSVRNPLRPSLDLSLKRCATRQASGRDFENGLGNG